MSEISDTLEKLPGKAKRFFEKYLWPTFRFKDHISPQLEGALMAQDPKIRSEFYFSFERKIRQYRNRRNFGLVLLGIGAINGVFPLMGLVIFYWWYTKKQVMPTLAGKIYRKMEYRYRLSPLRSQESSIIHKDVLPKKPRNIHSDEGYDPSNVTLEFLQTGFMFDFDLKTWEVVSHHQYDWKSGKSESIFKCIHNIEHLLLTTKKEGGHLNIFVWNVTSIYAIDEFIEDEIKQEGKPRNILMYQGETYYRDTLSEGASFDLTNNSEPGPIKMWEYFNADRDHSIRIEQRDGEHYRAMVGKKESSFKFNDVLPR